MQFEYYEKNGIAYVKEIYQDGSSIACPKPQKLRIEEEPHIPNTQLDNELAILEGMASMAEKLEKLEQNQITILEGIATQEEEHTP